MDRLKVAILLKAMATAKVGGHGQYYISDPVIGEEYISVKDLAEELLAAPSDACHDYSSLEAVWDALESFIPCGAVSLMSAGNGDWVCRVEGEAGKEHCMVQGHSRREAIDKAWTVCIPEPMTFEQALALCSATTIDQARHWRDECNKDGLPTPFLDARIAKFEANGGEK